MSNDLANQAEGGTISADSGARTGTPGKTTRSGALPAQLQLSRSGAGYAFYPDPAGAEASTPSAAPDPFGLHLAPHPDAQVQLEGEPIGDSAHIHEAAQRGISGSSGALPFLDTIQQSFGRHDVGAVQAHTDGTAATAATAMGATAYATGNSVAFAGAPDLHTAAHEAAHVVQQRAGVSFKGGVGAAGDQYEQHADAVADAVVAGRSAEGLLDQMAGGGGEAAVQKKEDGGGGAEGASAEGEAAAATESDAPDVFICFVPLAVLPSWLPSETFIDHAFLSFGDGWSAGFTALDGEPSSAARVHIPEPRSGDGRVTRHAARRKTDATSKKKTSAEIKQQIKTYAETVSPGRYNVITNNCGDWVKRAFDQAWLRPETPGHVY